eukprot:9473096-Pyramimonas_sp.AAC.1
MLQCDAPTLPTTLADLCLQRSRPKTDWHRRCRAALPNSPSNRNSTITLPHSRNQSRVIAMERAVEYNDKHRRPNGLRTARNNSIE